MPMIIGWSGKPVPSKLDLNKLPKCTDYVHHFITQYHMARHFIHTDHNQKHSSAADPEGGGGGGRNMRAPLNFDGFFLSSFVLECVKLRLINYNYTMREYLKP